MIDADGMAADLAIAAHLLLDEHPLSARPRLTGRRTR